MSLIHRPTLIMLPLGRSEGWKVTRDVVVKVGVNNGILCSDRPEICNLLTCRIVLIHRGRVGILSMGMSRVWSSTTTLREACLLRLCRET